MEDKTLSDAYVVSIATRVVNKLRGRWPADLSRSDAVGDATLLVLTLAPTYDERMRATGRPRSEWPNFESWLVKRVWGDLMDKYGRAWRKDAANPTCQLYDREPSELGVDGAENRTSLTADVEAALAQLSDNEAYAIRCLMYGMTQSEIGEAMDFTQPYVSSILKGARAKLATLLADYATEETE